MRRDSLVFLVIGFAVGFALLYFWIKDRAPQMLGAMATLGTAQAASPQSGAGADSDSSMPAPPPVDMAQVQELQSRLKTNPKDYDALIGLGNIDYDQRNFPEAATYYTKALEIRPNEIDVRTDLGTVLLYSQKYDEAMAQFQKSLAINPNHPQTLFNMGVLMLHGKNDPKGAIQMWQKLIDTNPDFPQIAMVKQQLDALKNAQK